MSRTLKVADLFCGAGGSSTGCQRALARLGLRMDLAVINHWPVAIETHMRNHPEARHYCQDVSTVRPRVVVPGGKLDLLMASPTCTHHSRARGGRPTSDQQRMDPWLVIAWLTELRVSRLIIENVPEFTDWGPVDVRTGKPIHRRKGEYFSAWLRAIEAVGLRLEWRILNAADFGDVTTRERFFLLARSDRKPIRWPAPSHSRDGQAHLDSGSTERWRAAREIIDWDIRGRSIFDRKRPLSPKTLARIYAGARKFRWPEPFLVILRNHMDGQSIDRPLPAITAGGTHIGLAEPQPFIFANRENNIGKSLDGPLPGMTTAHGGGICAVEPFILSAAHGNEAHEKDPHTRRSLSLDAPLGTIHAGGGKYGVVEPFVLSGHAGGAPRSTAEPMPGMTAKNNGPALIAPYYGSGSGLTCSSAEDPLPTCTAKARFGMVLPVTHDCDGNRARDIETAPLPTITTAARGELAFIAAAFGERPGQTPRVHSIDEPAPTICAEGRIQLVEPDPRRLDILFRMLEPHELAGAMGFSDGEARYEFSGTKTDVIRQIGNAVPVNTAAALVTALAGSER